MTAGIKDIVRKHADLIVHDGYYSLLSEDFRKYLLSYLNVFESHRPQTFSESQWKALPFEIKSGEWAWRRESLEIVLSMVKSQSFGNVLEIGAWNGWLTKHLAKHCNHVVAADYFSRAFDGISNIGQFAGNISPLQCRLATISDELVGESFDLIVVNHCLSFTENPADYIGRLKKLLRKNGIILSVGNTFYRDPSKKIRENALAENDFREATATDLYILPVKGFMDLEDKKSLIRNGFTVEPYPKRHLHNFYARLNPSAPMFASISFNSDRV